MILDWKILLGIELAQLYLEMTKLPWVGWVTCTATFRQGHKFGFLLPYWWFRPHPIGTHGVAYPYFLIRKEVTKLSKAWGDDNFTLRGYGFLTLFITDKALARLWVLLLLAQSLKLVLSDPWRIHSFLYWVTRSQLWNLRRFTSNGHHVLFLLLLYFISKRIGWYAMVPFLFN